MNFIFSETLMLLLILRVSGFGLQGVRRFLPGTSHGFWFHVKQKGGLLRAALLFGFPFYV
jgi:hypothetical protein